MLPKAELIIYLILISLVFVKSKKESPLIKRKIPLIRTKLNYVELFSFNKLIRSKFQNTCNRLHNCNYIF